MPKNNKDTAVLEDMIIPLNFMGLFLTLENNPLLSKKQKYQEIRKHVLEYINDKDRNITECNSGNYILNQEGYIKKITDAYERYTAMKKR